MRTDSNKEVSFYDEIFENEMKEIAYSSDKFYENLVMREVVKKVFY